MTPLHQRNPQPANKHILTTENRNLDSAMSDISDGNPETNVENGTRATPMPHTTLPKLMCDTQNNSGMQFSESLEPDRLLNEAGVQGVMRPIDTESLESESPAQDRTYGGSSVTKGHTSTEQNR